MAAPIYPRALAAAIVGAALAVGCSADGGRGLADAGEAADPDGPTDLGAVPATSFPVEIIGPAGTGVEVVIDVPSDALAAAAGAELALMIHNVVQPDSVALVVNGGAPIDLGAPGGPFLSRIGDVKTGVVPVELAALRPGVNRFTFRYTRQVIDASAAVSGFRVLSLSLSIDSTAYAPVLPEEDPASWTPVRDDPASLERGRMFFQEISRDGGPACGRCHADSGADLAYFAFSNHSIIERALFHEFARDEAEDIASYIRSLADLPVGRPFDAPLQPGAGNRGSAGAGADAILADDQAFAVAAFGGALPDEIAWDWAAEVDTFRLPTTAALPTWGRWLPRELPPEWFTARDGALAEAEARLASEATLESAQEFMSAALSIGRDLVLDGGDHVGKVEVMRFAAVKLWDWSRRNGFDASDHGTPDQAPAYPYEVGFAFFETALTDLDPEEVDQTVAWWWAQLASYPGRGNSNSNRPLDFEDVQTIFEVAQVGPATLTFIHLFGSWEESRGLAEPNWGLATGPVRLLAMPMRSLPPPIRGTLLRRFFAREREFVDGGGVLDSAHHSLLADAWATGCDDFTSAERIALRAAAPAAVQGDLVACP
jgi:hypothetical protein